MPLPDRIRMILVESKSDATGKLYQFMTNAAHGVNSVARRERAPHAIRVQWWHRCSTEKFDSYEELKLAYNNGELQ